jgi:hypothetical protein
MLLCVHMHVCTGRVIRTMFVSIHSDTSLLTTTLVESKLDIITVKTFVSYYRLPRMVSFLVEGHLLLCMNHYSVVIGKR